MTSTVVRDPVHGLIGLEPTEWALVDTPVFQRLRSIRQLAMTHMVYPGALHSRFEHSIGACHVAQRLAAKVELGAEETAAVRVAGLLHDVGHGPFSHVSEQVIDELAGVKGVHEAVSVYLIRNDPRFSTILGGELSERAARIVGLVGQRSVSGDIVSGPTDADKLDYLLRDSYFAGVKYGVYDLGRIIDSARVIAPRTQQTQLGFDADGVWAVEGLLMARHHMHRQVYGHKTRLATDIMITRALRFGIEEGVLPEQAYRIEVEGDERGERIPKITEEFVSAFLDQTDERVLAVLAAAPSGSRAGDLAARLASRNLLRQTVSIRLDLRQRELGAARYADLLDPEVFTRERLAEFERDLAEELGVEEHLLAIHMESRSNPTFRPPDTRLGRKEIMVQRDEDQPQLLHAESEIFRESAEPAHSWIHLYTPALDEEHNAAAKAVLWDALMELTL